MLEFIFNLQNPALRKKFPQNASANRVPNKLDCFSLILMRNRSTMSAIKTPTSVVRTNRQLGVYMTACLDRHDTCPANKIVLKRRRPYAGKRM